MTRAFEVHLPTEQAYLREVQFAVEVLDAVTLSRVTAGLKVVAEGLTGKPRVNAGGVFVWLKEDTGPLEKITIDPGALPYQKVERLKADLTTPLTIIELPPTCAYRFAAGITGLRGSLIESRAVPPKPVPDAEVHLRWLDDDGVTWREGLPPSRTDERGEFTTVLRFARADSPRLELGAITVRLRVNRDPLPERGSADLKLPQGRVADPSNFDPNADALTFAWDEMQP